MGRFPFIIGGGVVEFFYVLLCNHHAISSSFSSIFRIVHPQRNQCINFDFPITV